MTSHQQAQAARRRSGDAPGGVEPAAKLVDEATPIGSGWALSPAKRSIDLAIAVLALPVVVPVVVVAGFISMVRFRTWPLFIQQRRGLHQRPFKTVKIRSLPTSFPEQQGKLGLDVSGHGRWSSMLRHSHVDELPQVFNVLGGSMSLVGPRPMIDEVLHFLDHEDRAIRARVRPGMTGAWQVSTAGSRPLHDCPQLDAAYVRLTSARTDMRILGWTTLVLLRRRSFSPEAVLDGLAGKAKD